MLQANEPTGPATAGDAREVVDGSAHWRAGLGRAVARLQDAQLILVEDRDEDPDLSRGIGEDVQVAVINARDMGRVPTAHLRDAQAIVLTHAEEATSDEAAAAVAACRERFPGVRVFVVGPGAGDDGLAEWARWVRRRVMRRRG